MLKIYSIKEIVEATNNLLAVSNEVKEQLIIDPNNSPKEKYSSKKSIPKDIESIILEAENSQIQKKENNSPNISSQEEKDSFAVAGSIKYASSGVGRRVAVFHFSTSSWFRLM